MSILMYMSKPGIHVDCLKAKMDLKYFPQILHIMHTLTYGHQMFSFTIYACQRHEEEFLNIFFSAYSMSFIYSIQMQRRVC